MPRIDTDEIKMMDPSAGFLTLMVSTAPFRVLEGQHHASINQAFLPVSLGSKVHKVDPNPHDLHPGRLKVLRLIRIRLLNRDDRMRGDVSDLGCITRGGKMRLWTCDCPLTTPLKKKTRRKLFNERSASSTTIVIVGIY